MAASLRSDGTALCGGAASLHWILDWAVVCWDQFCDWMVRTVFILTRGFYKCAAAPRAPETKAAERVHGA